MMFYKIVFVLCCLCVVDGQFIPRVNFPTLDGNTLIPSQFTMHGGPTTQPNTALQLTNEHGTQQNAVSWYNKKFLVRGFDTNFTVQMTSKHPDGNKGYFDGFTFLISSAGLLATGVGDGGLGYGSVPSLDNGIFGCIAIEFDQHQDDDLNDPSPSHISIHGVVKDGTTTKRNNAHEDAAIPGGVFKQLTPMGNNTQTTFRVMYDPTTKVIQIFNYASSLVPLVHTTLDLNQYINIDSDGAAFVGFSSSTGKYSETHEIVRWSYNFLGKPEPTKTKLTGDGFTKAIAGETATFEIQLVDQFGNDYITTPVPKVEIDMKPKEISKNIQYNEKGKFTITYNTTVAGKTELQVLIDGVATSATALPVNVEPDCNNRLSISKTTLVGNGWPVSPSTRVVAGSQQSLVATVHDVFDNQCLAQPFVNITFTAFRANPQLLIHAQGGAGTVPGTYNIDYIVDKVGKYDLSVTVQRELLNQNASIEIIPDGVSPAHCIVTTTTGSGLNHGVAGTQYVLNLNSFDEFDNRVFANNKAPKAQFVFQEPTVAPGTQAPTPVSVAPTPQSTSAPTPMSNTTAPTPKPAVVAVKRDAPSTTCAFTWLPGKDGIYPLQYHCDASGTYKLSIFLDGIIVANMPQTLVISSGDVQPGNCFTKQTGIFQPGKTEITATSIASFQLLAVDEQSNPIEENKAKISLKLNQKDVVNLNITYISDGLYSVSFPLTKAGSNQLDIFVNDKPIKDAQRILTVIPANADAKTTTASGEGLSGGKSNDWLEFTVQMKDEFGNNLQSGLNHTIACKMRHKTDPTTGEVDLTNNNDGTWKIAFRGTSSGAWLLDVTLDGNAIKGSPFGVTLAWSLSTGALVGIGGGCVGLLLLIVAAFYFMRRRRKTRFTWERL